MDQLEPTLNASYSENMRAQFGMAYEKFVFSNLVRRLVRNHHVKTICEYPANDLMGNNSEEFERFGCSVERLTTSDSIDEKYDLVWNFCEFERSGEPYNFVQEMRRLSEKFGLIVTQNKYNVLMFHRIYHLVKGKDWDHGFIKHMSSRSVMKVLSDYDCLKTVEVGAFDVPWFLLDFYEGGTFFRRLVPASLLNTQKMKESMFENFPMFIKTLLAHHHYVLWKESLP